MKCPYCAHDENQVLDSRDSEDLSSVRRRRECLKCSKRFTTYERGETTEIPSKLIGELVMRRLKVLDKVAYIRFASVYRAFGDVGSFEKEVKNLMKSEKTAGSA